MVILEKGVDLASDSHGILKPEGSSHDNASHPKTHDPD